jgi:orotidine-5'-phosphate decarboxylase
MTMDYIKNDFPETPVIMDAKLADIGNTNEGYVEFIFDYLGADAITVHPYLGSEAMKPFLDRAEKGVIVLCRTSNKGAGEFQDLDVGGMPLYQKVAHMIMDKWNYNANCGVVVGATYPDELRKVRHIVGSMPILIPGIGAQGGDVKLTVEAGVDKEGKNAIINSSRGIIFASPMTDFAEKARIEAEKLTKEINKYQRSHEK